MANYQTHQEQAPEVEAAAQRRGAEVASAIPDAKVFEIEGAAVGRVVVDAQGRECWVGGTGAHGEYIYPHNRDADGRISGPEVNNAIQITELDELRSLLQLQELPQSATEFSREGFRSGRYIAQKEADGSLSVYWTGGYHRTGLYCGPQTFHHGQWDTRRTAPGSRLDATSLLNMPPRPSHAPTGLSSFQPGIGEPRSGEGERQRSGDTSTPAAGAERQPAPERESTTGEPREIPRRPIEITRSEAPAEPELTPEQLEERRSRFEGLQSQFEQLSRQFGLAQAEVRNWPTGRALEELQRQETEVELSEKQLEDLQNSLEQLERRLREQTSAGHEDSHKEIEELRAQMAELSETLEEMQGRRAEALNELELQQSSQASNGEEGWTIISPSGETSPEGMQFPEISEQGELPSGEQGSQGTREAEPEVTEIPEEAAETQELPEMADTEPPQSPQTETAPQSDRSPEPQAEHSGAERIAAPAELEAQRQEQQRQQEAREREVREQEEREAERKRLEAELRTAQALEAELRAQASEAAEGFEAARAEDKESLAETLGRDVESLPPALQRVLSDIDAYLEHNGGVLSDEVLREMASDLKRQASFTERWLNWGMEGEIKDWLKDYARAYRDESRRRNGAVRRLSDIQRRQAEAAEALEGLGRE